MQPTNSTTTNYAQRRTGQSCEHCHRRKVRCDLTNSGARCTNCQLDGRLCKRHVPMKRGRKSLHDRGSREEAVQSPAVVIPQDDDSGTFPNLASNILDAASPEQVPSLEAHSSEAPVFVPFYYHKYIQRVEISHLSPVQVQLLEEQGCLKVPSGSVLHEFFRQYFLYVHPCLPILNEGAFWSMYEDRATNQSDDSISLALFQAILFAASRFVSLEVIEACGFKSLKNARSHFHRLSELLLLNNVEKDHMFLAQTSLLLSLQSTINEQSLNSVWLNRAIKYAKQSNAHRYYQLDEGRLERKKLWWSCILRDRMIAIGVRRNVQITSTDFDFDQAQPVEYDFPEGQEQSQVYCPMMKKKISQIIQAECELAIAQTPTIVAAYGQDSQGVPLEGFSISQLVTVMTEIERAKAELAVWARRFKVQLLHCKGDDRDNAETSNSVTLFADMALIYYESTLVALANHEILTLKRFQFHLDDYSSRLVLASTQLSSAIANVANRVKRLNDQNLAHHLPISAPACTALPFFLEAIDLRLSTVAQKPVHQKHVEHYSKIMRTFRAQHDHTECVTTAVDSILRVAEPDIRQMLTAAEPNSYSIVTNFTRPYTWSDMLVSNPALYLRLYLFLDRFLSLGTAPSMSNLPIWILGAAAELQQAPELLSSPPLLPTLTPRSRLVELNDKDDEGAVTTGQWPEFDFHEVMDYEAFWPFPNVGLEHV